MNFRENSKPIYRQIADKMMDDIMAGRRQPDDRIPSVRELAAALEVNANTAMRAYEYLSANDVIYNRRGVGYFIAPQAPEKVRQMQRTTFFDDELGYFFSRLTALGVTPAELDKLYTDYYTSSSNTPQ